MATGTPATAALTRAGIAFTLHPYDHDPRAEAYGEEAAAALGVVPERIFKTLIATVDGKLVCGVVPVAGHLSLKALAAALGGKKASMADPAAAARATGYVVGGISPIGQKSRLPVVVDQSAAQFATVFVSAGKRGLQVELAPTDLLSASGARLAVTGRASKGHARCIVRPRRPQGCSVSTPSINRAAAEAVFLDLLDEQARQGRHVSASRNAGNFAPKAFSKADMGKPKSLIGSNLPYRPARLLACLTHLGHRSRAEWCRADQGRPFGQCLAQS